MTAITRSSLRVVCLPYPEDGSLQGADIAQFRTCKREAVKTDTQTAHVELEIAKAFNSSRVADMLDDRIVKTGLQLLCTTVEILDLREGKVIKLRFVGACEVREDGGNTHGFLMRQTVNEPRHVFFVEAKPVHAGVDLDMDRYILQTFGLSGCDDSFERLVRIDIRTATAR